MYTLRIVDTIEAVKKDEWDAMCVDDIYATHGWLKTVEEAAPRHINAKYFIAYESGKMVGGTVGYVCTKTEGAMGLDGFMFGRLKKYISWLGISFSPVLLCGPKSGIGTHFFVGRNAGPEKTDVIMNALLKGVETYASEHKLSISFNNVMDDEAELGQRLYEKGYNRILGAPMTYIDIAWPSFEGYLNSLKSFSMNMKKVVRREINKNKKEGVIIEELDNLEGNAELLWDLMSRNYYKHNKMPFPTKRVFLKILKENLGKDAMINIAVKKEKLVGVGVVLKRGKIGHIPFSGVDHETAGNDFTYFNLAYYRPIADAISNDLQRLYFGKTMYELKARRGCKLSNTYVYYRASNKISNLAVRPWCALLSARYKWKIPRKLRQGRTVKKSAFVEKEDWSSSQIR